MDDIAALEGSGEASCLAKAQEVKLDPPVDLKPEGSETEDVKLHVVENLGPIENKHESGSAGVELLVDPQDGPTEKQDMKPEKEKLKDASEEEDVEVTEEVLTADDTELEITPEKLDRESQFERAEGFFTHKKYDLALKNYLACIHGIERASRFASLPKCIRRIADVYHLQGEDEKAVHFLRAEKMYYETALIDTKSIQDRMESLDCKLKDGDSSADFDLLRAAEYENLGQLCRERKQVQLALEFTGKATKLCQRILGDSHETTQRCLTLFTQLYAEVGKEEYREKLESFTQSDKRLDIHISAQETDSKSAGDQPKLSQSSDDLTSDADISNTEADEEKPEVSWLEARPTKFLLAVMFICLVASIVLFGFAYCRQMTMSPGCRNVRLQLSAYKELTEYGWYKLTSLVYEKQASQ